MNPPIRFLFLAFVCLHSAVTTASAADAPPNILFAIADDWSPHTPPAADSGNNDYAPIFTVSLGAAPRGTRWFFWEGASEPHRGYEFGSGVAKGGKNPSDIDRFPAMWPDNETTRNDLLDYAFEV